MSVTCLVFFIVQAVKVADAVVESKAKPKSRKKKITNKTVIQYTVDIRLSEMSGK